MQFKTEYSIVGFIVDLRIGQRLKIAFEMLIVALNDDWIFENKY